MKLTILLTTTLAATLASAQKWSFTGPDEFNGSGDGPQGCKNFNFRHSANERCHATVEQGVKIVWYEYTDCSGAQTQVAGPADDLAFQSPISTRSYAVIANP